MDAGEMIAALDLAPHPEGGWYRETRRGGPGADGRSTGTAAATARSSGATPSSAPETRRSRSLNRLIDIYKGKA